MARTFPRVLVLAVAALAACHHDPAPAPSPSLAPPAAAAPSPDPPDASPESPPASASAAPIADAAPSLSPLPGFFEALAVPGHPDAWISLPTGATAKRPVVIVIHGAGDRPDWQCGGWRHATQGHPFILCPRGKVAPADSTKDDIRYTHVGGPALLAHIDAALAALVARYPDYVDPDHPLLAGFSLGSHEIVPLAVQDASRFPRIALVEGITDGFDDGRARAFVKGGGQRVLFGCGQRGCKLAAEAAARRLQARDGLPATVVFAPVDHTFDPPLEDAVHGQLPWLVQDDPRWAPVMPPKDAADAAAE
jgi:poly(3-hydroxybutyrate) depolymerase